MDRKSLAQKIKEELLPTRKQLLLIVIPTMILCLVYFTLLAGCVFHLGRGYPGVYVEHGDKWQTENKEITFYVIGEDIYTRKCVGKLLKNGEPQYVIFNFYDIHTVLVQPIFAYDGTDYFYVAMNNVSGCHHTDFKTEDWYGEVDTKRVLRGTTPCDDLKEMTLTVPDHSVYDLRGQTLTFQRVASGLSDQEIEYPPMILPHYYEGLKRFADIQTQMFQESVIEQYGAFDLYNTETLCGYYKLSNPTQNPEQEAYYLQLQFQDQNGRLMLWNYRIGPLFKLKQN